MQALNLLSVFQIEIPLIIAIAVGGAAIAEVAFPTWQARFERESALRDEQARAIREGCFTLPSGKLPQVRQLSDPLAWGVHPTAASSGSDVVPFVPRDVDEELRAQLTKNAFVLVVGDSTAGKSRCAFEAVRAVLPRHTLIIPTAVGSIAATLKAAERYSRCVLWLDDINRWFASPELTREAISQLLTPGKRRHRVVVATLRAAEADNWSTMPEEATALDTYRKVQDLLKLARLFRLDRLFSPAERERARDYVSDARIADALSMPMSTVWPSTWLMARSGGRSGKTRGVSTPILRLPRTPAVLPWSLPPLIYAAQAMYPLSLVLCWKRCMASISNSAVGNGLILSPWHAHGGGRPAHAKAPRACSPRTGLSVWMCSTTWSTKSNAAPLQATTFPIR